VAFAKKNKSLLVYDAAYALYITNPDCPKTIYEIEGEGVAGQARGGGGVAAGVEGEGVDPTMGSRVGWGGRVAARSILVACPAAALPCPSLLLQLLLLHGGYSDLPLQPRLLNYKPEPCCCCCCCCCPTTPTRCRRGGH
jgi:hypothetical protein